MTLEEIKQQYPNEWVLIEFTELDNDLRVAEGRVLAHSSSKESIYETLIGLTCDKIAIEFTGDTLEEPAYWL